MSLAQDYLHPLLFESSATILCSACFFHPREQCGLSCDERMYFKAMVFDECSDFLASNT